MYQNEILNLKKSDIKYLLNKTAKIITITQGDQYDKEINGKIIDVGLADNAPHLPFDLILELTNGQVFSISILKCEKIEFIE